MKTKLSDKKPVSISEACKQEPQAFQRFLDKKDAALDRMNKEVDNKTRAALCRQTGWAVA